MPKPSLGIRRDGSPASLAPSESISQGNSSRNSPALTGKIRACDSCYKRKIKCDGVKPQCDYCRHRKIHCTYHRQVPRRTPKGKASRLEYGFQLDFEERVERIEKLLADSVAKTYETSTLPSFKEQFNHLDDDVQETPSPSQYSNPEGFAKLHFAGHKLGSFNPYSGIPLLTNEGQQWIKSRTGETVRLATIGTDGLPGQNTRQWLGLGDRLRRLDPLTMHLPPRALVEECLQFYSSSPFCQRFPVIDVVLMKHTIRRIYDDADHSIPQSFSDQGCLYAFLACFPMLNLREDSKIPFSEAKNYIAAAFSFLPDICSAKATTEGLQTLLLIAMFSFLFGDLQIIDLLLSSASRFVYMLGGHIYPDDSHENVSSPAVDIRSRTIHHRRDLFWVCYTFDKELSYRTGRPPVINDISCDLTFPPGYVEETFSGQPFSQRFPGDLRLTLIKSRAYINLYSPQALRKSDAELLKDIRELDNDLENWRVSFPIEYRPTLSFSQDSARMPPPSGDREGMMHQFMLRLEYHLCMATIHQASSRCKTWSDNTPTEGVNSSLALAVQASRSSIFYLRSSRQFLERGAFWIVLFYPISAILTIFCNLLLDPLHPSAAADLDLLHDAFETISYFAGNHSRLSSPFSPDEVSHVGLVGDFVRELVRLAGCAIKLAREGEGDTGAGGDEGL